MEFEDVYKELRAKASLLIYQFDERDNIMLFTSQLSRLQRIIMSDLESNFNQEMFLKIKDTFSAIMVAIQESDWLFLHDIVLFEVPKLELTK